MSTVCVVVLGAGQASRFGSSKLAAMFRGESLLARAVHVATETVAPGNVYVIVSGDIPELSEMAASRGARVVTNTQSLTGIASSIRAGISALPAEASAALIMLADQPLVDASDLHRLIERWQGCRGACVAAAYDGTVGAPALFPREAFAALLELRGDCGAGALLARSTAFEVRIEPMPHASIDVDTPADLAELERRHTPRAVSGIRATRPHDPKP